MCIWGYRAVNIRSGLAPDYSYLNGKFNFNLHIIR
jgi:hypothetical protein